MCCKIFSLQYITSHILTLFFFSELLDFLTGKFASNDDNDNIWLNFICMNRADYSSLSDTMKSKLTESDYNDMTGT